jgi:outer membrane protein assembly factor BamE (lipoprotein component of BamABCDE complex)
MRVFRAIMAVTILLTVIGFVVIALAIGVVVVSQVSTSISITDVNSVHEGLTREEVVEKIGMPHDEDGANTWYYRVFGAGDMLNVDFDNNGNVTSVSF